MTDHFALVPPESPVLNGGDWLDLGTKECPACDGVGGPYPVKGNLTAPRCLTCNGSGRVPVVPTWTCPTCGGSGCSELSVADYDAAGIDIGGLDDSDLGTPEYADDCPDCTDGVVHFGELTVGVAAHECPNRRFRGGGIGGMTITFCDLCGAAGATSAGPRPSDHRTVPAALTENITVQAYRVVAGRGPYDDSACVHVNEASGVVSLFEQGVVRRVDITEHFPVPPNPGEWVGRIIERRELTEPITEYPCGECGGDGRMEELGEVKQCDACIVMQDCPDCGGDGDQMRSTPTGARVHRCIGCLGEGRIGVPSPLVALPQGVGLYEADPALQREIERRLP